MRIPVRSPGHTQLLLEQDNNTSYLPASETPHDNVYDKYYLFAGIIHIKWLSFAKQICLLLYLLRMVQLDVVQKDLECFFPDSSLPNRGHRLKCTRSVCLWLHYLAGLLPRFLVKEYSSTCLWFLGLGIVSCFLMLTALYWRERDRLRRCYVRKWIRVLSVAPSLVFEMFVIFFCYYAIFVSVEWRIGPHTGLDFSVSLRAVLLAALLSGVLLLEVVLHFVAVWYICDSPVSNQMTIHHFGPSRSQSILDILKMHHPVHNSRSANQTQLSNVVSVSGEPGKIGFCNENHSPLRDSGNVTSESKYGRLRSVMMRGGSGCSVEEMIAQHRDSNSAVLHQYPHMRQDMNMSNNSDYQQIRNDHVLAAARAICSNSRSADHLDTTYLEVV